MDGWTIEANRRRERRKEGRKLRFGGREDQQKGILHVHTHTHIFTYARTHTHTHTCIMRKQGRDGRMDGWMERRKEGSMVGWKKRSEGRNDGKCRIEDTGRTGCLISVKVRKLNDLNVGSSLRFTVGPAASTRISLSILTSTEYLVSRDVPIQIIQVSRDIPVQNIQSVQIFPVQNKIRLLRIFQYHICS